MNFTAAKATKQATVSYRGNIADLSVSASEEFVTVSISGNAVSVTCAANNASGATARTATVTITDGVSKVEIAVKQAA